MGFILYREDTDPLEKRESLFPPIGPNKRSPIIVRLWNGMV